jgi:hypothetical protein
MVPFILVGIWILFSIPIRIYVQSHGTAVQARVDAKRIHQAKSAVTHYVHFLYSLNGHAHSDEQQVRSQDYERVHIGQTLPARAMELGFMTVCVTSLQHANSTAGALVFALFWDGFIVLFLVLLLRPQAQQRRLVREGTAVPGTIVRDREWLSQYRGRSAFYLTFSFKTVDGQDITKEIQVPRKSYEIAVIPSPVTVLYDPARPSRSIAYEYCDYEVVPMVG